MPVNREPVAIVESASHERLLSWPPFSSHAYGRSACGQNWSRSQRPLSSDLCSNIFGGEPVNSTFSAGKNTSIPKAPPVRRWQKVQWHTIASRGNPRTRYRTSRQRQPPSWKSVIAPPETRKYQHCTLLALHAMRSCANGWSAYPPRLSVNTDILARRPSATLRPSRSGVAIGLFQHRSESGRKFNP